MKYAQMVLLAGLALAGACKSDSPTSATSAKSTEIPCTCGQPEADFEGCPCPSCSNGVRNPDNPDCVCGPLSIGGKGGSQ